MRLRSLRLQGFKSFADRTEVQFHEGITAIVGPNGCGKSNISDAIRWVLGEQRPTAIRGAKMEEAIFQGSLRRRPVQRGFVAIGVSNEDGALPVPFEEVELGRTVYRDGGSEYSINRTSCRLRDVQDLCRDTGLGANAYSIIESRMIDAILSDRTEERRGLFEEAAGIGKYKDRRKGALRRLERAELDLERLDDVVAEVQTKVRSLARQRGKAERFHELRRRRLDLESHLAAVRLSGIRERRSGIAGLLSGEGFRLEGHRAAVSTAELEVEAARARRVDLERERSAAAAALDQTRRELARWERELAVAAEREEGARRRLTSIELEREEVVRRGEVLDAEQGAARGEADRIREDEQTRLAELGTARDRLAEARTRLSAARAESEAVEARANRTAHRLARLEGELAAAGEQAGELAGRRDRLREEVEATELRLESLNQQGDLFSGRVEALDGDAQEAVAQLERARAELQSVRAAWEEARRSEREAADALVALEGRRDALEGLERDREGIEPVVREALGRGDPGVLGALGDFLVTEGDRGTAIESFLGPHLRALVVRDGEALERVAEWFSGHWKGGGGLIVLRLDQVGDPPGPLPEGVRAEGAGAPWIHVLLGGAEWIGAGGILSARRGAPRLLPGSGGSVDALGVVRLGNPLGNSGLLLRREQLAGLRKEVESAAARASEFRRIRTEGEEALARAEAAVEAERQGLEVREDEHRKVRGEVENHRDLRARTDRALEELRLQRAATDAAIERVRERESAARAELAEAREEGDAISGLRGAARSRLEEAEGVWEGARAEESLRALEHARAQGEAARIAERIARLEAEAERSRARLEVLALEQREREGTIRGAEELRRRGAEALEGLFRDRDEGEARLAQHDLRLAEADGALARAEAAAREARREERERSEGRHALELEDRDLGSQEARIRERLETEWDRPLEDLIREARPVEGESDALEAELREVISGIAALGPVNMLAMEEHDEESVRLAYLSGQREDLIRARDDLRTAIREINQTATRTFLEVFERIRENFRDTYHRLFEGGECDLRLADPEDPLESPIEVHASPGGKRTQRIDLLSGGERALTALSLLFGIYRVKPSPFCVLDEVDAPLDENNIGRFIRLLEEFKGGTQFVVITHNPRTIEAADWIYGVTMEEPGVSTIVGVRLEEALQAAGIATPSN